MQRYGSITGRRLISPNLAYAYVRWWARFPLLPSSPLTCPGTETIVMSVAGFKRYAKKEQLTSTGTDAPFCV